jgi:hypothetical protein
MQPAIDRTVTTIFRRINHTTCLKTGYVASNLMIRSVLQASRSSSGDPITPSLVLQATLSTLTKNDAYVVYVRRVNDFHHLFQGHIINIYIHSPLQ